MRFGAHYLPTYVPELDGATPEFYARMFEQMDLLDELGYDDVWVTEHHFDVYGGTIPDPPTFLAAVARTTSRIHLGVAISVLPLRNPLQVAESYAMVDVISNGRLEFGLGRGSTPKEFEGFGIARDDTGIRMRESLEVIRQAWTQGTVNFSGEALSYEGVGVLPRPVSRPHPPIWVGASRSDDTFRWAGEQGFHLMTLPYMYEPPVLQHWIGIYREALAKAGHDPSTREILGKFHIYVSKSLSRARDEANQYLENYRQIAESRNTREGSRRPGKAADLEDQVARGNIIAGDPARCIEIIEQWRELLGLTTISGTFYFGGMPPALAIENIRLFADKVAPAFERHRGEGAAPKGPAQLAPAPSG
jgi:natural product biosynthesis luciferase-like monooxygenase protein